MVYLDGDAKGAIHHGELPPGLRPKLVVRGKPFPIFNLAEYLESLGIAVSSTTAVHLVGGRRSSLIDGDEFRRVQKDLHFAFTRANAGKPRMDWPSMNVVTNTRIDVITGIYVYKDKPPPTFDMKTRGFVVDGKPVKGVPYAKSGADAFKGARVYLDGELLAALKRKDDKAAGDRVAAMVGGRPQPSFVRLIHDEEPAASIPWSEFPTVQWESKEGGGALLAKLPTGEDLGQIQAILMYSQPPPPP